MRCGQGDAPDEPQYLSNGPRGVLGRAPAVLPGDGLTGPILSYTNNGDGTVTDNNTGLMWEVKDNSVTGIHDKARTFTWSTSIGNTKDPNGTIFTDFLPTLNTPPCFAGHCDWRLPNVKELLSIVDYSRYDPSIAGVFPGPTISNAYWSSTAYIANPVLAYYINFYGGDVNLNGKVTSYRVRAVRGGR